MDGFEFEWVGEEIHRVRRQRGWSQKQLGDLVGVSQGQISRIEKGIAFDWATIKLCCERLDIPLESVHRGILGLPETEGAIVKDATLTVENRALLIEIYKLLQKSRPLPGSPGPDERAA